MHVYLKKHRHCRFMFQKSRPCHTTTPPFLEMCKPKIPTHEDLCGRGTSGRGHQGTSSSFSRRKWSFYPGAYTVSSCTTQTPSNASSWQLTSSTASSYNQTVRRKHTHTYSRSLQTHKHSPTAQQTWINIPLSGKWESLYRVFLTSTPGMPSRGRKTMTLYPDCKEQALIIQKKSHLSPNPEAIVQPEEPFHHRFHTFPLSFP